MRFFAFALLLTTGMMAYALGGDEAQPPRITADLAENTYISPGASTGVQDSVEFTATINSAERLVIKGYSVTVTDSTGTEVYTKTEQITEEDPFFRRMMIAIGFAGLKTAVTIPESLIWEGVDTDGNAVSEGEYSLTVAAWDDKGGRGASRAYTVTVDNTAPRVGLTVPYAVFSPNDDGNQDILIIEHLGAAESEWSSEIRDSSNKKILGFEWTDSEPENITWDGKDATGVSVADGSYSYVIKGTDRAGNTYETAYSTITVDTRDTPVSVSRDLAYFSPNGDGSQDTLSFSAVVPVTEGIKSWSLTILNAGGTAVRSFSGNADASTTLVFDGKSDSGRVLTEGPYQAELSILYTNGNNPKAKTETFEVDLTPPTMALRTSPRVISPNGDGRQDKLLIYQEASAEEVWNGKITDAKGDLVRSVTWRGTPETAIEWDGYDQSGEVARNGMYTYTLSCRDRAGNYAEAKSELVQVDLRDTPVSLSIEGSAFSPNADSVKDTIALVPEISDKTGIDTVSVKLLDSAESAVRVLTAGEAPEAFFWDGKNNAGRKVSDGTYSAEMTVKYKNGNEPTAKAGPIVVDTRFPSLKVSVDNLYFSPDNDGARDTLPVNQKESSSEQLWSAAFLNEDGQPVKTYLWTGRAEGFTWDGSDDDGNRLLDGKYSYSIESTDSAGNRSIYLVEGITIDTRETPVSLRISGPAFSPNGDGVQDDLMLEPQLDITENIASWKIDIYDGANIIRRSFKGESTPGAVKFDGRDEGGNTLPEGLYYGNISVLYRNGNNPSVRSGDFSIDVTSPVAEISSGDTILSPNGDGIKDTITVNQYGSSESEWKGIVRNTEGAVVRTITWFGDLTRMEWGGKDDNGKQVADGNYTYKLETTDKAGNTGGSNAITFMKDTRVTTVSLAPNHSAFSPNGDGKNDTIIIEPHLSLTENITSYQFSIETVTGSEVYSEARNTAPPESFVWRGSAADGFRAPDGSYRSRLVLTYKHGNEPVAVSQPFVLDTKLPSVRLAAEYTVFSPDGDRNKDELVINQETSEEDLWEGVIRKAGENTPVVSFFWKGRAGDMIWDGKDSAGNTADDGQYSYEISCTDSAGNSNSARLTGIKLDNRNTSGYVSPAANAFSPNGDGTSDSLRINLYTSPKDGISSWELAIVNSSGRKVRSYGGSSASLPANVQWDGKRDDGSVIDGAYKAKLRVEYEKGNIVEAESARDFTLDATPPRYTFRITPLPFSPDDDGQQDTVNLSILNVNDASSIQDWKIEVKDPTGKLFFTRSGQGEPSAPVVWNGKSKEGELVQAAEDYPVTVTVTDLLGNAGVKEDVIPVDVLVFREGDRLKIRISSIAFAPNSPDFLNFDEEKAERNMKTLTRLAEILQKYSDYQIRIEGHAVSVYWNDPARARQEEREELLPLSTARAEAVKKTLVDLGIAERRMTAVGLGGAQPVVPHSDLENRWKSRRVEFILVK